MSPFGPLGAIPFSTGIYLSTICLFISMYLIFSRFMYYYVYVYIYIYIY
jgi:hypothetical protein